MWFLTYIGYLAIIVQLVFITIAIAAGLYYLAELVEEYSTIAKKCIWWTNTIVTALYVCLWLFESFPTYMIVCGVLAQVAHFCILRHFPSVSLTSLEFISAVILLVLNHYFAFTYFATVHYVFSEVMAYFVLWLWLVPFALFVSLSANDSVLPTISEQKDSDVVSNYFSKKRKYGLLTFFNYAKESLLPMRTKKIF
ncbi:protein TEX261 [Tribolium madens]|uniref:protein TEX261 n=1 Tax=Tribolium madens TaxID=41895 RepID=UPI001CF74D2C|nr:protein TEX261 [Tribolium madens]